jgi:hypothetical protein
VRSGSDLAEKGVKRGLSDHRSDEARGSVPEPDCRLVIGPGKRTCWGLEAAFSRASSKQDWRVAPILA